MYGSQQSRFLRHGPCDKCGSRDNVAHYEGGTSYCFGCGSFSKEVGSSARTDGPTSVGGLVASLGTNQSATTGTDDRNIRPPPDDLGTYYPKDVLEWFHAYDIFVPDLVRHNVKWSPSREQVVYLFYGEDNRDVILWQARNFKAGTTHKNRYFTGGTPEAIIATYPPQQGENTTAVIVEDCASAIKLSKSGYTGVPVFGSKMSPSKMRQICKMYSEVIWWLDGDKFDAAFKQSKQCQLLGVKSRVIHTTYDPKEYDCHEIQSTLSDRRYH